MIIVNGDVDKLCFLIPEESESGWRTFFGVSSEWKDMWNKTIETEEKMSMTVYGGQVLLLSKNLLFRSTFESSLYGDSSIVTTLLYSMSP